MTDALYPRPYMYLQVTVVWQTADRGHLLHAG